MEEGSSRGEVAGAGFLDRGDREDSVVAGEPLRHPWRGRPLGGMRRPRESTSGTCATTHMMPHIKLGGYQGTVVADRGASRAHGPSAAWANRARAKR